MLIEQIAARLKTKMPGLRKIGAAADLAAARDDVASGYPCAYVILISESGAVEIGMVGASVQERTQRVAVVLATRNMRDLRGDAAGVEMQALRTQVDAVLFGWQPTAVNSPLRFVGGKMITLLTGELWWQDEYDTITQRRTL